MASGTIYGTTSNQWIECALDWYSTPNQDTNKSTVRVEQYYRRTNIGYVTENYGYYSININGVTNSVDAKFTTIRNDWVLVNTFTVEVEHNADGTKSIPISCTGYIRSSSLTATYCSGTVTLDTIPRASAIKSAANVQFNQNVDVKWLPLSVNFRYKVKVVFGSWSYTSPVIHPNSLAEYTFNGCSIPIAQASQIPNASSGTATVSLMTYSDSGGATQIGNTDSKTISVTLPQNSESLPSVSVGITPVSSLSSAFQDLYIQGKSKLKATISASGKLGATIKETYFVLQGETYGSSAGYTTGFLPTAGSFTLTAYAKDSRGFLSQITKDFVVQAYSKPQVKNVTVQRCTSNGTVSDSGTYIKISATQVYATVSGRNSSAIYYRIRTENGSYGALKQILASGSSVSTGALESGTVAIENTYYVEVVAQDTIGESGSATSMIPTASVYEHEAGSIGSYGFGKYVTDANTFDIATDKTLKVRGKGTIESDPVNANDVVPKKYVDAQASAVKTYVDEKVPLVNVTGGGDYTFMVIPLCKVSTNANSHLESATEGTYYFKRHNGIQPIRTISVQAENQYTGAYRFNISTLGDLQHYSALTATSGYGFRTCSFQYNSVWYGGICMYITEPAYTMNRFVGASINNTVCAINVYQRNAGTVLNSEIYNSIMYDTGDFNHSLYRNKNTVVLDDTITRINTELAKRTQMEMLWPNAKPTSSFDAQTIPLNLSGYSKVLVYFRVYNGGGEYNVETFGVHGLVGDWCIATSNGETGSNPAQRAFHITTTGITFERAYYATSIGGSLSWSSNQLIPTEIYGIKGA